MLSHFLDSLLSRLKAYFDLERLGRLLGERFVDMIIAVVVLAIFCLMWRVLNRVLAPRLKRRLDKTSIAFTETIIKFSMFSLGVIAALSAAGIKTTALLGSLGVAALTIGCALRDTLSNIISGFLVFLDRPFTIDDLVEIDGKYGRVDRVTLRITRIVTNVGRMLSGPNEYASQNWYDVWLPNVSPPPELMKIGPAAESEKAWAAFVKKSRAEMANPDKSRILDLLAALSDHANLSVGCYCENEHRCYRSLLRNLLAERGAILE